MSRLLVLVTLAACGNSTPTPVSQAASDCAAIPVAAARRQIAANGSCVVSRDRLVFQVLFPIDYTKSSAGPLKSRDLYGWDCDRKSHTCSGVHVDLDHADAGKPITMFDVGALSDGELVSETGDVFTIRWGPLRTFTVDLARGVATYVESNENTYGRGDAPCEVGRAD